ncbi:MAG TPA: TonB-dependent receptor [Gallionellaceae bacterium]
MSIPRKMFHQKTLVLVLAAMFPAAAYAADEATPAALDEIVVSAPREAIGSHRVDGAALAPMRASTSDAAGLLRDVPGVSLNAAGGVSSLPSLHGLADDRLRQQVDGMDLVSACANHMNPPLSYIAPSSVGSIEVFGGIAPVSAGGDSIGGTVQVNSPEPEFAGAGQERLIKGQVGVFYRSNGNAKGGNLSATIASEKTSMTYSGSTAESGNYKAGGDFKPAALVPGTTTGSTWLAGDEVGSSRYKSENHSLAFAMRNDNHLLELRLGVQHIPYQGFPNQRMDMTGNDSEQINLRYKGRYQWGAMEARVYNEHTRHRMQFDEDKQYWYVPMTLPPGSPNPVPGMPMDTEGRNAGVVLKADIALTERDTLRVGSELQRYRLNDWWDPSGGGMWPNTFWNINDGHRDRFDIYGEWEARWNTQWTTQLGARAATVAMDTGTVQGYNTSATYAADVASFNASDRQRTDHNLDLTALARYAQNENSTYEFGLAQKTRSPNLYERFAWSTGGMAMRMVNLAGDGNGYVGNLDLKPEIAHTLSATADWHDATREEWGLKVTPYYTYIQDYIDVSRCSGTGTATGNCGGTANVTNTTGFVYLRFVNQNARIYGVDVSAYMPLAKTDDYGSFKATGMVSYVDGRNETTGDNLYNIMPLNARLAVVQNAGSWSNTVEGQFVAAKTNVSQVRDELQTPGYALLNLRSSYEWKQVRLDVGIENVFDRLYSNPLGGAYVGQGATMQATAVPWGIAVPGMGRSIYAAVNVKF